MKTQFAMLVLVGIIQASAIRLEAKPAPEGGIQFFRGSWAEALKKAESEKKKLFVDFYADWCGPCKWMTKEVFTNAEVGEYFNSNIIAVKVNAEKEEADLVKQMNLQAYPTLAVFDATGSVLAKTEGALAAEDLIAFIKTIGNSDQAESDYRQDSTNFEKFGVYLQVLKFKDQSKISGEVSKFMDRLPLERLQTEEAWKLVVNSLDDYNSNTFKTLCENAKWFKDNHDNFEATYIWFMNTMLAKAVENQDSALLQTLKDRYITVRKSIGAMPQSEGYYEQAIGLAYKKQLSDSTFAAELLKMAGKLYGNDWKALSANVLDVLQSGMATPADKQLCLTLARKALALNNNSFTNWTMAAAYQANSDVKDNQLKAKSYTLESIKKAKAEELNLNNGGYASLTFEDADKTIVNVLTKFE